MPCTGLTASWCPIHGDCTCPRRQDGEPIPYGQELDGVQGYDLDYPHCPLHGRDSTHGETVSPDQLKLV